MNKSVLPSWLLLLNCQKEKDRFLFRILKEVVNVEKGLASTSRKNDERVERQNLITLEAF